MKKFALIISIVLVVICIAGCGSKSITPDYTDAASFEAALNDGMDVVGKTVQFKVDSFVPNSAFGYNLMAGEHLNFCSTSNPKVADGDTVIVEVTDVESLLGSFIISYKIK